jgi:adenylate cyclase
MPNPTHERALVKEGWEISRVIQRLRLSAAGLLFAATLILAAVHEEYRSDLLMVCGIIFAYLLVHGVATWFIHQRPPTPWRVIGGAVGDSVVITAIYLLELWEKHPPLQSQIFEPVLFFGLVIAANGMRFSPWPGLAAALSATAGFAILGATRGYAWDQTAFGFVAIALFASLSVFGSRAMRRVLEQSVEEARLRDRLRRFLAAQVADQIAAGGEEPKPGGELKPVSVLFADLRHSTALAERLGPQEFLVFLNEYYSRVTREVFNEAGTLDKFVGDGVLVFFGAPQEQPDHAERAVRCAMRLQLAMQNWNGARRGRGEEELALGCGIATGEAIVGVVGTKERLDYTVIGDTVNLASRVEDLTKEVGADVLITGATRRGLSGDRYTVIPKGWHQIRGRTQEVEVFQVLESATGPLRPPRDPTDSGPAFPS